MTGGGANRGATAAENAISAGLNGSAALRSRGGLARVWRLQAVLRPLCVAVGASLVCACAKEARPVAAVVVPLPPRPPPRPPRAVPRPAEKPQPPPGLPPPSSLVGLAQPDATRLFGAASERAEQPPATLWRYKTENCELDLYFYLDLKSGRMRALRYAFRGDAVDQTSEQDCLRAIAEQRNHSMVTPADAASSSR